MQITDIVSKIIKTEKIPIYMSDSKLFSSVTYLKPNLDIQRGLYLPNCDSLETLKYCKANMPDGFRRIKEMICTKCAFDEISFCVFSILHECGHWIQYKDFIAKGHNDSEFIFCYELQRVKLYSEREIESKNCRSEEDIVTLNEKYEKLYAELPTEKYANDFALNHLCESIKMIK